MTIESFIAIPQAPDGWFNYRYYLLSSGDLAVLRTDRDINAEYKAWWERMQRSKFPRKMPDFWKGKAFVSIIDRDGDGSSIEVPLVRYPELDRFADGRWLVASTRAVGDEANGLILEKDGRVSRSFSLGDGIEHVRCAPDGSIWVGYFDEGVFGSSIGSGGLINFDSFGKPLWSFNDPARSGDQFIDDCYALTLNESEVWTCFYSGFPITRLTHGREISWVNKVTGARALAVDDDFVLLAGGYGADANQVSLLELRRNEAALIGSFRWPELESAELVSGRSNAIHVVTNQTWNRITIDDVRHKLRNE